MGSLYQLHRFPPEVNIIIYWRAVDRDGDVPDILKHATGIGEP